MIETSPGSGHAERAALLSERLDVPETRAADALGRAWREHQIAWHARRMFGASEMTAAALDDLGVVLSPQDVARLVATMEEMTLARQVAALDGAHEVLDALARLGIRRALICDTGFSPGRVVRTLLDRIGLLEHLEVTVFSNEVGVPKPHERMFATALGALGVAPSGAVHVGDIRRSDVAGARAAGMGTIRLAQHYDDDDEGGGQGAMAIGCAEAGCLPKCPRPEADAIALHHRDLPSLLDLSTHR